MTSSMTDQSFQSVSVAGRRLPIHVTREVGGGHHQLVIVLSGHSILFLLISTSTAPHKKRKKKKEETQHTSQPRFC